MNMKNIHIIPTDKSSRLYEGNLGELVMIQYNSPLKSLNIYITNNEEIKEGDWFLCLDNGKCNDYDSIYKANKAWLPSYCKKIIITTDEDLIKDGVQEIPEYFLIHYIVGNNPIEYVEIKEHLESIDTMKINYEIIIPKEEPKQLNDFGLPQFGTKEFNDLASQCFGGKPKQETQVMNKTPTAVQWLANELVKKGFPIEKYGMDLYEQAKEMEKQQIFEAYDYAYENPNICGEQYYNETF